MDEAQNQPATRLDQFVVALRPGLSRAFVAKLIEQGRVRINGQPQTKTAYRVRPGDAVDLDYDDTEASKLPRIKLPVIYEDDDCVVVNKPAGLLTHSKGAFNPEATVATWLADRVSGLDGDRAGIVHRLDRATSGVMICAKHPEALKKLQRQFSARRTKKIYVAIAEGVLKTPEAVIDMPIERNPKRPQTFRVGSQGKPAVTAYRVTGSGNGHSLLELRPTTGRTHQLRVHLAKLGHPIVGDTLYGAKAAPRLYLHARSLELTLPGGERRTFEAPLPRGFKEPLR